MVSYFVLVSGFVCLFVFVVVSMYYWQVKQSLTRELDGKLCIPHMTFIYQYGCLDDFKETRAHQ